MKNHSFHFTTFIQHKILLMLNKYYLCISYLTELFIFIMFTQSLKPQFTLFLVSLLSMFACKNEKQAQLAAPGTAQEGQEILLQKTETFGEVINADGAVALSDVFANLKTNDSIMCKVTGYVQEVCQVKGCWMTLRMPGNDSSELFVKFKDYAFFMPKDLGGSKVVLKGVAYNEITSVDELKHYAEDEGKSQAEIDAITKPETKQKFMADGVLVLEHN